MGAPVDVEKAALVNGTIYVHPTGTTFSFQLKEEAPKDVSDEVWLSTHDPGRLMNAIMDSRGIDKDLTIDEKKLLKIR